MMDDLVVELEVIKRDGKWYRKGLNRRGEECWDECEIVNEAYSDDWVDEVIASVNEERS